jgi:dTDP-4-amino-4,6-dideoxygalactose transaminase
VIKFLDLYAQYRALKSEIDRAMEEVIRDAAFIGGAALPRFEARFAAYQGAAHCVGVANGTDAIEIAIEALGLPGGSEVIVPANTFIATSEAVTRSGCQVAFADVDEATATLDPADVERRVTPRTSAIMAVHLYGQPCDMDALAAIARARKLRLIEDAAQAHGAEYRGRRVGALGDIGTFSFYPGKNLGAYGDAGAIVTNDAVLARKCRMIANHGRVEKYDHEFEGRNSRLDGLQAAILEVKLGHLDAWIARRNQIAARYLDGLRGLPGIRLPVARPEVRHAYHLFVIQCDARDRLAARLKEQGIQTGIHYPIALPKLKAYEHMGMGTAPLRANAMDTCVLSLPMGEHLSDADVDTVCRAVAAACR